jgi:hypothetical protein
MRLQTTAQQAMLDGFFIVNENASHELWNDKKLLSFPTPLMSSSAKK